MSNSEVPRIELSPDGSTLTLYVRVDGFAPGTPVEISGYATQDNGAIVTFYDIQQIPNGSGQTSAAWGGPATPRPGHLGNTRGRGTGNTRSQRAADASLRTGRNLSGESRDRPTAGIQPRASNRGNCPSGGCLDHQVGQS